MITGCCIASSQEVALHMFQEVALHANQEVALHTNQEVALHITRRLCYMLTRNSNYISIPDFIEFADIVDAYNASLPDDSHLNVYYIPLRKGTKIPATSKSMYVRDASGKEVPRPGLARSRKEAIEFLERSHGNIGILACDDNTNPSLALFDFDIEKNPEDGVGRTVIPEEKILEFAREYQLPMAISRQGGYHIYVVNDGTLENGLLVYEGRHAGEIRCNKQYVVAPGSHVPVFTDDDEARGKIPTPSATGTYRMVASHPFREFGKGNLPAWLSVDEPLASGRHKVRNISIRQVEPTSTIPTGGNEIINDIGISLTVVRAMDSDLDELLMGAIERDRSKADYRVACRLRDWGFGDQDIADILQTYRPSEKTNRLDYLELTISKADRNYQFARYLELRAAIAEEQAVENSIRTYSSEQIERRLSGSDATAGYMTEDGVIHLPDFPHELPRTKFTHVRGLPRIGKSHWTLMQLSEATSGMYVTANHDIIAQQFSTFHYLAPDRTKVWLQGKHRCCVWPVDGGNRFRCQDCPLRPRSEWNEDADLSRPTIENVELAVAGILQRDGYLCYHADGADEIAGNLARPTIRSNIPSWVCPYFALHLAASEAEFVFTVPYYTTSTDGIASLSPCDLLVMDEDTVFSFYAPTSISLFEYGVFGGGATFIANSHIAGVYPHLKRVGAAIEEKGRQSAPDKSILKIINICDSIDAILSRVTNNSQPVQDIQETRGWIRDAVRDIIHEAFCDISTEQRMEVIHTLTEYQRTLGIVQSDDNDIIGFAEALLFPHPDRSVYWDAGNPATLFIVADESNPIRFPTPAGRYLIVGFTEGEMFAEQMSRKIFGESWREHITKLHIEKFPYGKNFIIVRADGQTEREETIVLRKLIRAIEEIDNQDIERVPRLVLTSSKKGQAKFHDRSVAESSIPLGRPHGLPVIKRYGGLLGASMPFYANSRISRGIDVPFIDLLVADSCKFALPYMNATISGLSAQAREIEFGGEGDLESVKRRLYEAISIRDSLLTDETTNSVLRISPVIGMGESQVKVIAITASDARYINSEALSQMSVIPIDSGTDIEFVATHLRLISRRTVPVRVERTIARENPDYTALWNVADDVGDDTRVTIPGKTIEDLDEILHRLSPENTISTERVRYLAKIEELRGRIMNCPKISRVGRIKIETLKRWIKGRHGNAYTPHEVDVAIRGLVRDRTLRKYRSREGKSRSAREYWYVEKWPNSS